MTTIDPTLDHLDPVDPADRSSTTASTDRSATSPGATVGADGRPVPGRVRRLGLARLRLPAAVLAAVVGLDLWMLRHLLRTVSWPNDLPFHQSMVTWATDRFRAGKVPTDGWYSRLSGGLPQFHLYQSAPHVLTGLAGVALGPERATHLALWLLVGTWPIAVYLGARALGLTTRASLVAAAVSPLLRSATGYGFEPFSYLWIGNGLWSQAWGMWVAPLALGWSARAVREGRRYGRAVVAVGLTVAFHLPTAWFVLMAFGLWAIVRPSEWRRRIPRSVGLGLLSAVASAWVLVPFVVDRWASNDSSFNGEGPFAASFGWRRVLGWTLAGDVIDARRLPILSAVAALGLLVAVAGWRRNRAGEREVVALAGLSLLLFIGRNPFGPVIALLPGSSQVFLHRYVATLQLAMVLLVGIGADRAASALATWWADRPSWPARLRVPASLVLALLLVLPAVLGTRSLVGQDRSWVAQQATSDRTTGADAAQLLAIAAARGGGRVYAGKLNDWGKSFLIGGVSAPIWLANYPVDSLGYNLRVSSLAADLETYLDDSTSADLDGFGIRYVLLPQGHTPPRGAWFLASRGPIQLWEIPGQGMVSAVDLAGPALRVGNHELAAELLPLLRSQGGSPTAVREVDLEGRSPHAPVATTGLDVRPGTVTAVHDDLDAGRVTATARFSKAGAVLVKANWNPRWHATVDGRPVPVVMVAPTWLAIPVGAGVHHVALGYRPWSWTPELLVLAALAVTAAWWWGRRRAAATEEPGGVPSGDGAAGGPSGSGPADPGGGRRWSGRRPAPRLRPRAAPRPVVRADRARGGRRLVATAAVGSVALVGLAGCGPIHRLPPAPGRPPAASSPAAAVSLIRADSLGPLDRMLVPDHRTVVLVADRTCTRCAAALGALQRAAVGSHPFSLLLLGIPRVPASVGALATRLGISQWDVSTPPPAARRALGLGPSGPGIALFDPDGTLVRSWRGVGPSVAAVSEEAGRHG